jgi:hypothetical protein
MVHFYLSITLCIEIDDLNKVNQLNGDAYPCSIFFYCGDMVLDR